MLEEAEPAGVRKQDYHRAMAGLSMGGMQTLFVTLHHLDRFSYIGSFSEPVIPDINTGREPQGHTPEEFDSKTAYEGAFADPRAFNKRVKLLWLGVGTAESPMFRSSISGAATALQRAGVDVVYFESPGTAPSGRVGAETSTNSHRVCSTNRAESIMSSRVTPSVAPPIALSYLSHCSAAVRFSVGWELVELSQAQ